MHYNVIPNRKTLTRIGIKRDDFSVAFSLYDVPEIGRFVEELAEIHKMLCGDDSRQTVVLHGLGEIGR